MSRVLVVGGSPLQVPLIEAALRDGHWVAVADRNPEAIGNRLADHFVKVSTVDEEALAAAAVDLEVDAVVTMATDQPLRAVARANACRGLRGLTEDAALRVTRKDLSRKALEDAGVPGPRSYPVGNEAELRNAWEELKHTVILKPVDSSGSRGVSLLRSEEDIQAALDHALRYSAISRAVAEEYLVGQELSVETLSVAGEMEIIQITEKLTSGPPHFVEAGHLQPARLTRDQRREVEDITRAAGIALGIDTGPTHTEVIITDRGPKIIEVGARLGGDYITSDLVPLSTGIDMVSLILQLSLGQPVEIPAAIPRGAAIRYFFPPAGRVVSIDGVEQSDALPDSIRVELFIGVGERFGTVTGSHERAGYVIATGRDADEAEENVERAWALVRFEVEQ